MAAPLTVALNAAGYDVREVQANRTAERRRRRRRAKTNIDYAEAIARETLADPGLPPAGKHATPDPVWQKLTVLSDWRRAIVADQDVEAPSLPAVSNRTIDATRRAASSGSSCSQTRRTLHPASWSSRSVSTSRSRVRDTFSAQNPALVAATV